MDVQLSCRSCHMTCRSVTCFKEHLVPQGKRKESSCDRWWKCVGCMKVLDRKVRDPKDHVCEERWCKSCKNTFLTIICATWGPSKINDPYPGLFSLISNVHRVTAFYNVPTVICTTRINVNPAMRQTRALYVQTVKNRTAVNTSTFRILSLHTKFVRCV